MFHWVRTEPKLSLENNDKNVRVLRMGNARSAVATLKGHTGWVSYGFSAQERNVTSVQVK